jgi:hypothetical protein
MRPTYALFAVSLTIFGTALAKTHQEQATAEQEFKNIQSFKGEKASDVIPAMQFMSASLGVTCDFCHAADRASDEKRPKLAARKMIAMERDINAKNFGGRLRVTCATCHAGHVHPVGTSPAAGAEVRPERSADIKPDVVLAAYAKALGTAAPGTGLQLQGTGVSRGQTSQVDALYLGDKFTFTNHTDKGIQKQGYDGSLVWFTTPNGVQKVPLVYAAAYVNENVVYTGVESLPKLNEPAGGTAKIGDRDMLVVSGTITGDQTRISLYFDKMTGLLARRVYSYPTILGSIAQVIDFSDYRRVRGLELPMSIVAHSEEGLSTMTFRSARVEAKVDPAVFEPPK